MKIKNTAFVGIPVTDVSRARKFYEQVLGLAVSDEMMGGKWIEYTIGDNTLAIANVGEEWNAYGLEMSQDSRAHNREHDAQQGSTT